MRRLLSPMPAIALVISLCSAGARAEPVTYTIVSKISRVAFSLEHQGFIQLFGTLRLAPGNFTFDSDDWSKSAIDVTMPIKSLDMGDATWNNQIRGDGEWSKLFRTRAIRFHSTRLEHTEGNSGVLYGDLELAGVRRPVVLQLKFNKIGKNEVDDFPSVGFSATTTLKRSEFGLDAYSDLVGDAITVQIQVEAAQGKDGDAKHPTAAPGVRR